MKALIKGGLFLALGWFVGGVHAQDSAIKWQAANSSTPATSRAVTLSLPRPMAGSSDAPAAAIIRAQAAENKNLAPVPKLEVIGPDLKNEQKPKNNFPPAPKPVPTPIANSLTPDLGDLDDCCGLGVCRPRFFAGDGCSRQGGCWISAEYLLWWQKGQSMPPLVVGAAPGSTLLLPNSTILYEREPNQNFSGGRFSIGRWCPHFCNNLGFEVDYFFLGGQQSTATYDGGLGLRLGRPFVSVLNNFSNNVEVFNDVDRIGSASVTTYSQLWGIEGNARYKWLCGNRWWIDCLVGYRHLNLSEGIDIQENILFPNGTIFNNQVVAEGTSFVEREYFRTRNLFHGGQIGLNGEFRLLNRWSVGWYTKLGFGNVHQSIELDANTTRTLNGVAKTEKGALLITQTNIGRYSQDRFGVLSEVGVKIGYDITDHLRIFVGYDYLMLTNVARPGEQIDVRVNSDLRPFTGNTTSTSARLPAVLLNSSTYWAQGLNFGLLYRF